MEEQAESVSKPKLTKVKVILIVACLLAVVIASAAVYIHLENADRIEILDFDVKPENPRPGDTLEVTAKIHGDGTWQSPTVSYETLYPGGSLVSGTLPMSNIGGDRYRFTLTATGEGSQLWIVVCHSNGDEVVIRQRTIDVGIVEFTDNVHLSPVKMEPSNPLGAGMVTFSTDFTHEGEISRSSQVGAYALFFRPSGVHASTSYSSHEVHYPDKDVTTYSITWDGSGIPTWDGSSVKVGSGWVILSRFTIQGDDHKYSTGTLRMYV